MRIQSIYPRIQVAFQYRSASRVYCSRHDRKLLAGTRTSYTHSWFDIWRKDWRRSTHLGRRARSRLSWTRENYLYSTWSCRQLLRVRMQTHHLQVKHRLFCDLFRQSCLYSYWSMLLLYVAYLPNLLSLSLSERNGSFSKYSATSISHTTHSKNCNLR